METGSADESSALYKVFNIGNGQPINFLDFVQPLESALGIKAKKNFMPMQAGDVYQTFADIDDLFNVTGYKPKMSVEQGVNNFVDWYREFYG
ncbi:hypothetical protein GCM10011607_19610 [Shewanella inventionis]|uniref:Uncharacterized protein n=1 Tax=Shewanella inventionis TaxID=1738770 RepID=A0ABQ1J3A5_9GAMM|nr:hypothetical protein GCM10011607_19610 [Shewanella inventionis]